MKILVLGAGLQGSACAYDLLADPAVETVRLADRHFDALPAFFDERRADPRLEFLTLDACDSAQVAAALEGMDGCLNALPYYFAEPVTRLAIAAGSHYADLGGNTDIVFAQMRLDEEARAAGVSVIPDCGLAPGMVNILAADGMAALDETRAIRIFVGGLPRHPEPPLNYQLVYSLEGLLDYYTTPSFVLRDGRVTEVEALSEVEKVEFAAPVGTLEAFHTAGGISTMPWRLEGRVPTVEYKTLRYPGHADLMRAMRELGLFSQESVEGRDGPIVPRDAFIAAVEPTLRRPGAPDLVALRVVVEGTKDGREARVAYRLLDFMDESRGISAMERTTGFSLAIIGRMQARGSIAAGVATPDVAVPAGDYIEALAERGVIIERDME
ncbi:MAG TPA: saccharopine dehydrogenase C-terminal domain-containing protein [Longimicrobiales bacterium]|nr:saccharopine dehydrogenase C-terminal domain-containing protein [Longimicrobiales bacterium]